MVTLSPIIPLALLLLRLRPILASASYSHLDAADIFRYLEFSKSFVQPFTPSPYVIILRKARSASRNPNISRHTIKCMLYTGLWRCISADETGLEPRSMHHLIWEHLGEAIEMSTREVAQSVSGSFESLAVRERVAEQTINEMIMLFIPASKVMHAREILAGKNRTVLAAAPSYVVKAMGMELLTLRGKPGLTSSYDSFLMTKLAVCAWELRSSNCAFRGFLVQMTDEYETAVGPFDRTRLLFILRRFVDKKYRTITGEQQ